MTFTRLYFVEGKTNYLDFKEQSALGSLPIIPGKSEVYVEPLSKLLNSDTPFIYTLFIKNNRYFLNNDPPKIDPEVVKRCNANRALILIYCPFEGRFFYNEIEWVNKFQQLNNINKSNIFYCYCNTKQVKSAKAAHLPINFTYKYINLFEFNPSHLDRTPFRNDFLDISIRRLKDYIEDNRTLVPKKHFVIPMRARRPHRLFLFSEIKTNPTLDYNSDMSLGYDTTHNIPIAEERENTLDHFERYLSSRPLFKKNYEYIKNFDFQQIFEIDVNIHENQSHNNARNFAEDYFCTVVSETDIENTAIFFSEKTFRPITNLQPFVLVGNPDSLRELRRMGYITFSRWWDESYDEEYDYYLRVRKVSKVLEEIASWDKKKLFQVKQEMEQTLIFNFINFFYNRRYQSFIETLGKFFI